MNPNMITLRVVLLAVIVAVATTCMGAVRKGGVMQTLLIAEAPTLGWIGSGPGRSAD
jgi:hypothetical protein